MKFSLIITSINRKIEIRKLFESINNQISIDLNEIQIVFVDQGDNNELINILDKRIKIKYIKSDLVSLSVARNIALDYTIGEIIGFPDDDCWFSFNLLQRIYQVFEYNFELGAACFRVMDPDLNLSYGKRPSGVIQKINYWNIFAYPTSAGLFVRAKILKTYKLKFNIQFGVGSLYGANEDTEFIHQLLKNNVPVKYFGDISIYHPVMVQYSNIDVEKSYKYGIGSGALMRHFYNDKEYLHTFVLIKIILLSSAAYLYFCLWNRINARVMINRIKGIVRGLLDYKR